MEVILRTTTAMGVGRRLRIEGDRTGHDALNHPISLAESAQIMHWLLETRYSLFSHKLSVPCYSKRDQED